LRNNLIAELNQFIKSPYHVNELVVGVITTIWKHTAEHGSATHPQMNLSSVLNSVLKHVRFNPEVQKDFQLFYIQSVSKSERIKLKLAEKSHNDIKGRRSQIIKDSSVDIYKVRLKQAYRKKVKYQKALENLEQLDLESLERKFAHHFVTVLFKIGMRHKIAPHQGSRYKTQGILHIPSISVSTFLSEYSQILFKSYVSKPPFWTVKTGPTFETPEGK
jgi:hypothetical protein